MTPGEEAVVRLGIGKISDCDLVQLEYISLIA
jgi:hypothetical protein